jgi:uncharacterized protein (UPF0332 family)
MTLENLQNEGIVESHITSRNEIGAIIGTIERALQDSKIGRDQGLSTDAQFSLAYTAAKQSAKLALAVCGYRVSTRDGNHYWLIQSLRHTIQLESKKIDLLDRFRKKRNKAEYELAGSISRIEADEMIEFASGLFDMTCSWLKENHPELLQDSR